MRQTIEQIQRLSDSRKKICILGDVILDEYIFGQYAVKEMPVFKPEKNEYYLGGASNVALNIHRLGFHAQLFSLIGFNHSAKMIRQLFDDHAMDAGGLLMVGTREIIHKTRLINDGQILMCIDAGNCNLINRIEMVQLCSRLERVLPQSSILIISDYNKGCISQELWDAVVLMCKSANVKILVDSYRMHDYRGVFLLKPTWAEFELMTGCTYENIAQLKIAGREFKEKNQLINLIITMDKKGLLFFDMTGNVKHVRSVSRHVADTCGAGDAFLSALAGCITCGIDLDNAIEYASYAAAVCCGHLGTYSVNQDEIRNMYITGQV